MFQTRKLLQDKWADATGVTKFLNAYGFPIERPTVYNWFVRERVPSEWGLLLIALLEIETGKPVSLTEYVG